MVLTAFHFPDKAAARSLDTVIPENGYNRNSLLVIHPTMNQLACGLTADNA